MDWKEFFNDFADRYYSVPDFTNEEHVYALQNYLIEKGMLVEDVDFAIKTLLGEAPTDPRVRKQAKDLGLVSLGYGNWGKEKGGPTTHTNVDGKLTPVGDEKDDKKDKKDKKDDDRPINLSKGGKVDAQLGGDRDAGPTDMMDKDDVGKIKDDEPEEEQSKEELLSSDHQSADDSLNMTKTRAKEQAKKKGKKDVGLGTPESRAGEAMVHKGLRLLKEGKSIEQIEEEFTKLVNSDDHILNSPEGKKWVASTTAALRRIDEQIGIENIEDVAWDTDQGRRAIGVDPNVETSADMFVRTKDGKNIGISLKKDGKVFLNNGGWAKQSRRLIEGLEETMPPEQLEELKKAIQIEAFEEDRKKYFQNICGQLQPKDIDKMVKKLESEPDKVRNKEFGGKNGQDYINALKDSEGLLRDCGEGTLKPTTQMKGLAKLLKMYDKEKYDTLREIDDNLSRRAFDVLNTSDAAKIGMNKHIIKSMHILDTLGLNDEMKNGGVDSFITIYGIKPEGAVLNEENLTSLFGSKFEQLLSEQIKEVRDGTKEPKDLEDFMAEQIEIDYESGQILFKHENEDRIPLFYLNGRSKAIGASPTMELGQTPLMALALEIGTFDTSKWNDEQRARLQKELEKE